MNIILYPFSLLFGLGVYLRNKMFDWKLLRSVQFDIPIIVVGNLRVGGTGKTPHVEWLLNKLGKDYKIGVLSRGYGRKTKCFLWVDVNSTSNDVGDEPLQIKKKFPAVPVAVCGDRVEAIPEILSDHELDAIILDDAFQHRYIRASFSLVLSSANKPFFKDVHLPAGRLRETGYGLKRAQALVFSKSNLMDETRKNDFVKIVHTYQKELPVFFSYYQYATPKSLKGETAFHEKSSIITITGLADTTSFDDYVTNCFSVVKQFRYPDHFRFTAQHVAEWETAVRAHSNAVILTSEKDAIRMLSLPATSQLPIYYLPIEVKMDDEDALLKMIKSKL